MSEENKRRHLFISHHHQDDAEVTKLTNMLSSKGYDIRNSSVRMKPENQRRVEEKRVSDTVIERILRMKISWASTVVVLIGKDTHTRNWVNWEIDKAHQQGKRIVGVFVRGGTEADIPPSLEKYGSAIVGWNTDSIISAIDGQNNFQTPDGNSRSAVNVGGSLNC
ncbi:MTH538 TIR-like domain [Mucilaginibacter gossypiicola]|uniref:MTH538 TIR-like domain n=1 Tax=Mucilaginibacter gossypiicola TaxID=551995 RepID=A0A1H8V1U8_9SPHI|nr:TIR domain-containing protein [Mucilaginibacter gossypiicola]SEP08738.1 MTH538 TIR-like domain [Mucilaginibacter gossypiicola]